MTIAKQDWEATVRAAVVSGDKTQIPSPRNRRERRYLDKLLKKIIKEQSKKVKK